MVVADQGSRIEPAGIATPPVEHDSPVVAWLEQVHARHAAASDGAIATYIPELATADPDWFGIAIATVDGTVHDVGDAQMPFTIQSISKPLTYGLALDALGEDAVRRRVGVEPTGDAFNSITLTPVSGLPLNPMVNAGAIATASLFAEANDAADPFAILLAAYGRFAGHPLELDEAVYRSERDTGHRNRAIGHLLRSSGVIDGEPDRVVDLYFRQCSVVVTARDLAVIAATLAGGGVNPVTGERVLRPSTARSVLSVMATCGMYDGAGEWMYTVGLPAKSGVAGGLIAVLPGQLGIGIFSPPLDPRGNSVRAVRVCRELSTELDLHIVARRGPAVAPIRSRYSISEVGSKRLRDEHTRALLAVAGRRSVVFELQGELTFLAVERVASVLSSIDSPPDHVVLDLRRIATIERSSLPLLARLILGVRQQGAEFVLSGHDRHAATLQDLDDELVRIGEMQAPTFGDLDLALEWVEERLLTPYDAGGAAGRLALADHALLAGLEPEQLRRVEAVLGVRHYARGERIVATGDAAAELFLVATGRLSVSVEVDGGGRRRLSTLGPGMMFGEAALFGPARRSADVHADDDVVCHVLAVGDFDRLVRDDPSTGTVILRNLARIVGQTAQRLTRELAVIAG